MKDYSPRKNLRYMTMAYYRPKQLIDSFLKEPPFVYSILPPIIFTSLFEFAFILDYLKKASSSFHLLGRAFGIPDTLFNLYQTFLFPTIHITGFLIFGLLLLVLTNLMELSKVSIVHTVSFVMFT